MLQEVFDLLKDGQVIPIAKYFGKYGDLIYIYNQKTKAFSYIAVPTLIKERSQYKEIVEELKEELQEGYDILQDYETPTIHVFKSEYEQQRERILINNLHAESIALPLEDCIELDKIEERIKQHILAIRTGA